MSISALITEGFGSFGDVAHIVWLGLGADGAPTPDAVGRPGDEQHRSNWLWKFRSREDEEEEVRKALEALEELKLEIVVSKPKKSGKKQQLVTLSGKPVEQYKAEAEEAIRKANRLPGKQQTKAVKALSELLTEQAIFYSLAKRREQQRIAQEIEREAERQRMLEDDIAIAMLLLDM